MNPTTHSTILRVRRDLTLGAALKWGLLGGAALAMLFGSAGVFNGSIVLAVIGGVWVVLSYRSVRGSRMAAASPSLIASGLYEQAELCIDQSLRSFSLFRAVKLRSLHHLVLLRHAQRRWQDAAALGQALLGERLGTLAPLSRSTRLIVAESLLELGDLQGAHAAIVSLYYERLSLGEAVELVRVQAGYCAAAGAWEALVQGLAQKVEMAELMPSRQAAGVEAILALACLRTGRGDWAAYLARRASLLGDVEALVAARPSLREVWTPATPPAAAVTMELPQT